MSGSHSDGFRTFYEVLGVAENATSSEIKSAWKSKRNQLHPDKNPALNDPKIAHLPHIVAMRAQAKLDFDDVNDAYDVLIDPTERAGHDADIAYARAHVTPTPKTTKASGPASSSPGAATPSATSKPQAQSAPPQATPSRSAPPQQSPASTPISSRPATRTFKVRKVMSTIFKPLAIGIAGAALVLIAVKVRDVLRDNAAPAAAAATTGVEKALAAAAPSVAATDTQTWVPVKTAPPLPPPTPTLPQWTARLDPVSRSAMRFSGEYPQFVDGDASFNERIKLAVRKAIAEAAEGSVVQRMPTSAIDFDSSSSVLDSKITHNDIDSVGVVLSFQSNSPYAREEQYTVGLTYHRSDRRIVHNRSMPRMRAGRLWRGYYLQVAVTTNYSAVRESEELRRRGYPAFVLLATADQPASYQSLVGPFRSRAAADSGAYGLGRPFRTVTFDSLRAPSFASR